MNTDNTDIEENFFFLAFNNVDGYFVKNDGIKYLVLASANKNKEALEKYTELWNETKRQIETINDREPVEFSKNFTKTRFESDDDLPLVITLIIPEIMIVTSSVLKKKW